MNFALRRRRILFAGFVVRMEDTRLTADVRDLKKNLNASRPSEHPPVRGKNVKTFIRWDHRLQIIQNLFMAFKRVNSIIPGRNPPLCCTLTF